MPKDDYTVHMAKMTVDDSFYIKVTPRQPVP